MLPDRVHQAFAIQEGHCARMGSAFTAHLCTRLAELIDPETPLGHRIADWPEDPEHSALALRLCGALHRLVRTGAAPGLAALYPPVGEMGEELDAALADTLASHEDAILDMIASPPQTNEIGRAACLIGALMTVARETGQALSLHEIGAAAGLNLLMPRYRIETSDGRSFGPEEAPVAIAADWQGAAPETHPVEIAAARGCDRAPIDPADPEARERLMSYVWPDQPERLARTEAAVALAAAAPPRLERADAADWVEARLAEPAEPGTARVLMHSITWQYLPPVTRARIAAAMDGAGAEATEAAPLAWVAFERDETAGSAALTLTLWPGGETRTLARCDFHGAWARWLAPEEGAGPL
jgi:hypothetical protein